MLTAYVSAFIPHGEGMMSTPPAPQSLAFILGTLLTLGGEIAMMVLAPPSMIVNLPLVIAHCVSLLPTVEWAINAAITLARTYGPRLYGVPRATSHFRFARYSKEVLESSDGPLRMSTTLSGAAVACRDAAREVDAAKSGSLHHRLALEGVESMAYELGNILDKVSFGLYEVWRNPYIVRSPLRNHWTSSYGRV